MADLRTAVLDALRTRPDACAREIGQLIRADGVSVSSVLNDLLLEGLVLSGQRGDLVTWRLVEARRHPGVLRAEDTLKRSGLRERLRSISIDLEEAGIDACEHGLPHTAIKALLNAHSEVRRAMEKVG